MTKLDFSPNLLNEAVREYNHNKNEQNFENVVFSAEGLIKYFVRLYGGGCSREDLFQAGNLGLLKALKNFDLDKGTTFVTYASHCIIGEIRHFVRKETSYYRPGCIVQLQSKIDRVIEEYIKEYGSIPDTGYISHKLKIKEDSVNEVMKAGLVSFEEIDISRIKSHGYDSFHLPIEDKLVLYQAFKKLSEIQRKVVQMLFLKDMSQQQVADELSISQRQVSRVKQSSIELMREHMLEYTFTCPDGGEPMKQLKNKRGAAFVYVLLILVVGTTLLTGIMMVSRSESNQTINQSKNMKAYYIARAGADVMVHRLLTIDKQYWDDFTTTHTSNETPFGDGNFKVGVSRIGDDFEVTSVGTYQNESKEVKAVLKYNPYTKMEFAMYAKEPMVDLQIGELDHNIGSGGTITFIPEGEFADKAVENIAMNVQIYDLDLSGITGSLEDGGSPMNNDVLTDKSSFYDSIQIATNPHKTWTIDTTAADFIKQENTAHVVKMVPETSPAADWMIVELDGASLLKGNLIIKGDNNLMLLVKEQLDLQGNIVFDSSFTGNVEVHVMDTLDSPNDLVTDSNGFITSPDYDLIVSSPSLNMPGPASRFTVYLGEDTQMNLNVNGTFYGNVIGPDAQVDAKNGSTQFHGAIYAEYMRVNAQAEFYYENPDESNPVRVESIQFNHWE